MRWGRRGRWHNHGAGNQSHKVGMCLGVDIIVALYKGAEIGQSGDMVSLAGICCWGTWDILVKPMSGVSKGKGGGGSSCKLVDVHAEGIDFKDSGVIFIN